MNNVVRGVLCYTVPTDSVIIEDYFDNEVYDAKTGFRKGWLPYCEYDNRPLEHGNMYTIIDKRVIHVCTTDADGDLSKYGFKERESAFGPTPNERIWVNMEV
jgi:hypothetical protein